MTFRMSRYGASLKGGSSVLFARVRDLASTSVASSKSFPSTYRGSIMYRCFASEESPPPPGSISLKHNCCFFCAKTVRPARGGVPRHLGRPREDLQVRGRAGIVLRGRGDARRIRAAGFAQGADNFETEGDREGERMRGGAGGADRERERRCRLRPVLSFRMANTHSEEN